ncbi:MAG TPA: hypothetical protein DEG69_06820, partial [Flavobacteriaceae bacterium]|nr:hypothetical protein [Flavobacteriaceae bacterium]
MPYIQLNNPGFALSQMDLELLASQQEPPITVDKYIELNNIQWTEGEEFDNNGVVVRPEEEQEDFTTGAVQPSATAVPTNPTALENINTELLSEDISLDSVIQNQRPLEYAGVDEAQAEYDELEKKYPDLMDRRKWWGGINDDVYKDGYAERESARIKLEKASADLRNTEDINVNIPETFIGDYMENIEIAFNNPETGFGDIAIFQSTDNGVGAGNKNILTATIHANGDVLELPMNYDATFRGSDKQKKTFEENYQKLKDYQLSIINAKDINEVVRTVIDPAQIAGLVESFDEGNLSLSALNTQLATIRYEVKPIYEEITNNSLGSNNNKNKPETKIAGYELLKNGLPFNLLAAENDLSLNGLQAYLRNNLSSKETGIIKESINNDYSRWVQIQQSRKLN